VIVLFVDHNSDITDIDSATTTTSTTTTTINTSIVYSYTDDMFTIAGLINGCADFVLGFNINDIYIECISTEGSEEDNKVEIPDYKVATPTTSDVDDYNTFMLMMLMNKETTLMQKKKRSIHNYILFQMTKN